MPFQLPGPTETNRTMCGCSSSAQTPLICRFGRRDRCGQRAAVRAEHLRLVHQPAGGALLTPSRSFLTMAWKRWLERAIPEALMGAMNIYQAFVQRDQNGQVIDQGLAFVAGPQIVPDTDLAGFVDVTSNPVMALQFNDPLPPPRIEGITEYLDDTSPDCRSFSPRGSWHQHRSRPLSRGRGRHVADRDANWQFDWLQPLEPRRPRLIAIPYPVRNCTRYARGSRRQPLRYRWRCQRQLRHIKFTLERDATITFKVSLNSDPSNVR